MPKSGNKLRKLPTIDYMISIANSRGEVASSLVLPYEDNRITGSDADAFMDAEFEFMSTYTHGLNMLRNDGSPYQSVENVPLNKVVAYQNYLDAKYLKQLNERGYKGRSERPLYIKFRNKYYIEDGNHRTALAILNGKKVMNANVVDFDKWIEERDA